jgi:hypothetical protein
VSPSKSLKEKNNKKWRISHRTIIVNADFPCKVIELIEKYSLKDVLIPEDLWGSPFVRILSLGLEPLLLWVSEREHETATSQLPLRKPVCTHRRGEATTITGLFSTYISCNLKRGNGILANPHRSKCAVP